MSAPTAHRHTQVAITERDARLTQTDQQRKKVQRQKVWWHYSQSEVSPLGGDHPALFLHRRAQAEANRCACEVLSNDIALSDKYAQARAVRDTDPLKAQALLVEARAMAKQGEALTQAYDSATKAHLATMLHVLAVALAHKAQQVAVRKVAEVLYSLKVLDHSEPQTTAPPEVSNAVAHSDTAPPVATGDASTAPPARTANTDQLTATNARKGVVLLP